MSDQPQITQSTEVTRAVVKGYPYTRSAYEVHQEFSQLDPASIGDACTAWKRAADELLALADDLRTQAAVPLDAAWQDTGASVKAQTQLQYAEATARALANDCLTMAHATDYAAQYAQWYKDNLPSYTDAVVAGVGGLLSGNGLDGGAEQALTHMVRLLGRYNEVITTLPQHLQISVSQSTRDELIIDPPGVGGAGVPAFSGPAGGGSGFSATGSSGAGGLDAAGLVGGAHGVGAGGSGAFPGGAGSATGASVGAGAGSGYDPFAAGTSLAGAGTGGGLASFDPVGGPGGLGGLGGLASGASGAGSGLGGAVGAGALGAAGLGAGGLAAGLGRAGAGAGLAGVGGAGAGAGGLAAGGVIGGPGGAGAGGAGAAGGRGAGRAGAAGAAGGPMHGGRGGGDEEERERSTWLLEDEDVWSGDGDVPPPVIGG